MSDRALLLDVMSTLVRDPFLEAMPAFFGTDLMGLIKQLKRGPWVEFEHGQRSEESFLNEFFADGRAFDHAAFVAHVRDAYEYLPGIEALLARLCGNVPMYALSNYPIWYRHIEEKLKLSRFLDWAPVSCETGLRKPDPAAYENAAEIAGVPAARCYFVDDRESNCEAARAVGMTAHRFTSAAALEAWLVEVELL